ncbi:MAG: hypothetical protein ACPLSM_02565 [Thermosphaera sp.]
MGRKLIVDEDELLSLLEEKVSEIDAKDIVERAEAKDLTEKFQKKIERIEAILSRL